MDLAVPLLKRAIWKRLALVAVLALAMALGLERVQAPEGAAPEVFSLVHGFTVVIALLCFTLAGRRAVSRELATLEHYEDVKRALLEWRPATAPDIRKYRLSLLLGVVLALAGLGAWVSASRLDDPRARGLAAAVLYTLLILWVHSSLRNPNLPRPMKRSVVVFAIILALGPLGRWWLENYAPRRMPDSTPDTAAGPAGPRPPGR